MYVISLNRKKFHVTICRNFKHEFFQVRKTSKIGKRSFLGFRLGNIGCQKNQQISRFSILILIFKKLSRARKNQHFFKIECICSPIVNPLSFLSLLETTNSTSIKKLNVLIWKIYYIIKCI